MSSFSTLVLLSIQFFMHVAVIQPLQVFASSGEHGGVIVESGDQRFEVSIDPSSHHVDVFTLNKKSLAPEYMSIVFYREQQNTDATMQLIELKALDARTNHTRFQGELNPLAQSYVGAELRFTINSKAAGQTLKKSIKSLKFVPRISNSNVK